MIIMCRICGELAIFGDLCECCYVDEQIRLEEKSDGNDEK